MSGHPQALWVFDKLVTVVSNGLRPRWPADPGLSLSDRDFLPAADTARPHLGPPTMLSLALDFEILLGLLLRNP